MIKVIRSRVINWRGPVDVRDRKEMHTDFRQDTLNEREHLDDLGSEGLKLSVY